MASRLFSRDLASLDNNVVKLFSRVTFGASTSIASQLKISYPFELWGTGQLVFCFLRVVG